MDTVLGTMIFGSVAAAMFFGESAVDRLASAAAAALILGACFGVPWAIVHGAVKLL